MAKPIPIGISDFKELIDEGYAYIDKTLFIEDIVEKGTKVALLPRPRRFGKTLNLSMLQHFFEKTEKDTSYLFKGLQIWKNEKYRAMQGQFPVIFLTFKDIKHDSWERTFEHFRILIGKEFGRHEYLLKQGILNSQEKEHYLAIFQERASQTLYEQSLHLLTEWLHRYHGKRVIVLIDEYDAPAHAAYVGKYYDAIIPFLRGFLSGGFKDNSCLEKGALTGILRIAKESIFSGFNNASIFTILDKEFQDKFGLLESEVRALLKEYDLESKLPEIKQWYDGYHIGSYEGIYNPWSVLNCVVKKGALASYWVNTSDNAIVKELITKGSDELKVDIEELLRGGTIDRKIEEGILFSNLEKKNTAIWTLLLFSGYLTIDAIPSQGEPCRLRIPNIEVTKLYQSMILDWFEGDVSVSEYQYQILLNSLINGDIKTFSEIFEKFMLSSVSVFDVPAEESEKIYHAFVLGMLVGLKDSHEVKSNRESGFGRYDVILIPKDTEKLGIIMEFKKNRPSEKTDLETTTASALKQIEDRQYAQELLDRGIKSILYIGLAFEGKEVLIHHKFRA